MATLILGLFRTRHNGLFIPRRETAVTVAKTYSTESSIPTTRIQPAATAPSAIVPNRKEPPTADWIHVAASLLLPGTFTRDVSFRRKKLFCISRNWSEAVLHRSLARDGQDSLETGL